jgi:3-deoxy-7-phosphoheptulonate synthase
MHTAHIATPSPTPAELAASHPLTTAAANMIANTRQSIIDVFNGEDSRLIAIVGPCSEDDSVQPDGVPSVLAFAQALKTLSEEPAIKHSLLVIMRCPPAKPRSDLGTRGLEQHDLPEAHRLLTEIANLSMPLAFEVMNDKHIARYGDLASLAWIGARTQDTMLRHSLSLYPELPVLCKNGEAGSLDTALASIKTIASSHINPEIITPDGRIAHVKLSPGNPNTGIIWRGGSSYQSPDGFELGLTQTAATGRPYAVDCAHGNEKAHDTQGGKSVEAQLACFDHLVTMMTAGQPTRRPNAVMIEAYLRPGMDTSGQTPGMSITDPCIGLDALPDMLRRLAAVAGE